MLSDFDEADAADPVTRIYLDTNALIPFVEAVPEKYPALFRLMQRIENGRATACTSDLTFGEVLVLPYKEGNADLAQANFDLLNANPALRLVPVDRDVIVRAARLRAMHKSLKLPDANHLATAELAGCRVFISSDKDIVPRESMLRIGPADAELNELVESLA